MRGFIACPVISILAIGALAPSVCAQETDDHHRVEIKVEALLTPHLGYEEKNNVQVVLYGVLPNSCYTLAEYTTKKLDAHTIAVHQYAIRDTTGICAEEDSMPVHLKMVVPFVQEVPVGRLAAGDYRFVFNRAGGGDAMLAMTVAKNVSPSIDSLPYAIVSSVRVADVVKSSQNLKVQISGVLNSTCTTLDQNIKVMREDDVLVILPTVKVRHDVECAQVLEPFQKTVDLGAVSPGIHLIHTRSMNGKAINRVVEVIQ